jgi:hypothetical protein
MTAQDVGSSGLVRPLVESSQDDDILGEGLESVTARWNDSNGDES